MQNRRGYKTLKLLGKNKTRLLPSNWDEDEEYIFDDDYNSNDSSNDYNNDDNVDWFEEIDESEIDDLPDDVKKNEPANNQNENENQNQNENENADQAGVPDEIPVQELYENADDEVVTEQLHVVEDKSFATLPRQIDHNVTGDKWSVSHMIV